MTSSAVNSQRLYNENSFFFILLSEKIQKYMMYKSDKICSANVVLATLQAKTSQMDNDTPVLNALKALHGTLISMSWGETPVVLAKAI